MASGWQIGGTVLRNNGRNTGDNVWAVDAAAAQPIDAAGHDTHDETLADSIEACLHIGGYNAMTADLDMNTNDILSAVNIQASGDLVFTERADHASTPAAGKGYLWVKSDTPSSLIFTDDAGTDTDLTAITSDLVNDTTPQLGGSLDVNGNKIVSTSNGNIDIEPNGTGNVLLGNFTFNADQTVGAGQDNYIMTYDHAAGTIGLEAAGAGYVHPNHSGQVTSVADGATALTINAITDQADMGAAIVATDEILINDGGDLRRADVSRIATYCSTAITTMSNLTAIGTLGSLIVDNITLNAATITSDTGAISFSNENLTTTGTLASGALTVTGAITATGEITAYYTSDMALKQNIEPITSALDKVSRLNGSRFQYKKRKGTFYGLMAQDMQAVLPELVHENADGELTIRMAGFELVALLVEAIKELKAKIDGNPQ